MLPPLCHMNHHLSLYSSPVYHHQEFILFSIVLLTYITTFNNSPRPGMHFILFFIVLPIFQHHFITTNEFTLFFHCITFLHHNFQHHCTTTTWNVFYSVLHCITHFSSPLHHYKQEFILYFIVLTSFITPHHHFHHQFTTTTTSRNRQDVGSRRRFLLYSVYTWVVGAVLTTAVLVVPYLSGKTHDSSLMDTNTEHCKLKSE